MEGEQEWVRTTAEINSSTPPMAAAVLQQKVSDKSKRDEWSEGGVVSLLEEYESKWALRNRAKLKGTDWEDIARQVSVRCSGTKALKTPNQCKNKIESMKKRYRVESAAHHSSWQFYGRMNGLLKGSTTGSCSLQPKLDKITTTMNHDSGHVHDLAKVEVDLEMEGNMVESNREEDGGDDDGSNTLPNSNEKKQSRGGGSDVSTPRRSKMAEEGGGGGGNRLKRRRGEAVVAESIRLLAESMLKIEEARMEMYKETERMRAEAEMKRGEMELKRTEIIAETQLQIARLFSSSTFSRRSNGGRRNGGRSQSSSFRSEPDGYRREGT